MPEAERIAKPRWAERRRFWGLLFVVFGLGLVKREFLPDHVSAALTVADLLAFLSGALAYRAVQLLDEHLTDKKRKAGGEAIHDRP